MSKRTWIINSGAEGACYCGKEARAGERVCGWLGLLEDLEVLLGLAGLPVSPAQRVANLLPRLTATNRFWSDSVDLDPVGVAEDLIEFRDRLMMAGWNGQGNSERLKELSNLFSEGNGGIPDRLKMVIDSATTALASTLRLIILCEVQDVQGLHLELIQALQQAGAEVEFRATGESKPKVRRIHPPTASEAAEHLAAWLADTKNESQQVVIIGADTALDHVFRRHGLPASGASVEAESGNSLLSLFRLLPVIGENVPDPERVLEFLLLPRRPLQMPYELVKALHEMPAIGGDAWDVATAETIAKLEDKDFADAAAKFPERLEQLFPGVEHICKVGRLQQLFKDLLQPWLVGLLANTEPPEEAILLAQAQSVVSGLQALLATHNDEDALEVQTWNRYVSLAMPNQSTGLPAEAGIHFVQHPSQICAPADLVVWWACTADTADTIWTLPLRQQEREALKMEGVDVHAFEEAEARQVHAGWSPPFVHGKRLLLAVPQQHAGGAANQPHPVWDEHTAKWSQKKKTAATITGSLDEALLSRKVPIHPLSARRDWELHAPVPPRDLESPSGIESLLQCPYKWTMKYALHLREPNVRPLPSGGLLEGKVFHDLFHLLMKQEVTGATLVEAGLTLYDQQIARMAATWARPGGEAQRAQFRHRLEQNLQELKDLVENLTSSEGRYAGEIGGHAMAGRLDLVLEDPDRVIDFKNRNNKRDVALTKGTAVQLIAYAELLRKNGIIDVAAAYFILHGSKYLQDSNNTCGTSAWVDLEATYLASLNDLQRSVTAAGIGDEEQVVKKSENVEHSIQLTPGCEYCAFDMLCGKRLEENV